MTKGKREKAIKNLCWIRKLPEDDMYIQEELYAIDQNIERQMEAGGLGFFPTFQTSCLKQKDPMALLPRRLALLLAKHLWD